MLIDWFTVAAQIVNFLVLVWLLKIFLYKPILKVIADRQNEINRLAEEAKLKKTEAETESEAYRKKNNEFEQQKAEKIQKINEEIEQFRSRLTSKAQLEVKKQKDQWETNLKNEKETVFRDLRERVQKEIFSILRRAMMDLAEKDLEDQIVNAFLLRVSNLDKKEKEEFASHGVLQIKTALDLKETLREKIIKAIQQEFGKTFEIKFLAASDLIAGIQLISDGRMISWNIADYLSSLEFQVDEGRAKTSSEKQ